MTNIHELLQRQIQAPSWQGDWARIWLKPDVFSGQEYIVGAVALDGQRILDYRLLTSIEKFACIYGDSAKPMFEAMFADLRAALTSARASNDAPPPGFLPSLCRIERVGSLRTQLASESLDRMLRDGTIPLEPNELSKKQRFESKSAASVVNDVLMSVKLRSKIGVGFIRESVEGESKHEAAVNLVTPCAAGIIASGWYASADRISVEFYRAAKLVEMYAVAKHLKNSSLFFLRPTVEDGLSPATFKALEEHLDLFDEKVARENGIRVVTHDKADVLANSVLEWAEEFA